MPIINQNSKQVCFRIMYYGLPLSGRTSSLEIIHKKVSNYVCKELTHEIITKHRDYLYFEFISPNKINDITIKYRLFVSPSFHSCFACGHHMTLDDHISDIDAILDRVDGIIFIVDSQKPTLEDNIGALNLLKDVSHKKGLSIEDLLLVIQWNKRDLEDESIVDVEKLEREINYLSVPSYETTAVTGEGMIPAFKKCMELMEDRFIDC
ncbi:hypothetical protein [Candidatus Uabimicrobium sp. HlEnr_7]|uniref:hypothetical protein n=1 Tax=Candidatus Uabimicrobium helgolandensis TaxID=3095367 RepID=UPI003556CCBC